MVAVGVGPSIFREAQKTNSSQELDAHHQEVQSSLESQLQMKRTAAGLETDGVALAVNDSKDSAASVIHAARVLLWTIARARGADDSPPWPPGLGIRGQPKPLP